MRRDLHSPLLLLGYQVLGQGLGEKRDKMEGNPWRRGKLKLANMAFEIFKYPKIVAVFLSVFLASLAT